MGKPKPEKEKEVKARLVLVVTFDNYIEKEHIERIIDEARGYGSIERASFTVNAPFTEELV